MDDQLDNKKIDSRKPLDTLSPDELRFEQKRQVLIKRIIVSIVLLLKENPMLPFHFNFAGSCQLEILKQERHNYKLRKGGISVSKIESTEYDRESRLHNGFSASSFMAPGAGNVHEKE